MKLSFDFDGTLSRTDVQKFAKSLVEAGHDVWIVTSRISTEPALAKGWHWVERQNQELYTVAESVGIPRENIVFTEHVDKIKFLEGKNFLFHLDDNPDELFAIIKSNDPCKTVNVYHWEWESDCNRFIQDSFKPLEN